MKKTLNANTLKIIAIIAMLADHIAFGFLSPVSPFYYVLRIIGRITAPVMCFFIAEGFYHTRSVGKYMLRLFIFAVISHVPYRLLFEPKNPLTSSIMLPLFLGLCALWLYKNTNIKKPLAYLGMLACFILSYTSDWSCMPVFFILLFGIFHENRHDALVRFAVVCAVFGITATIVTPAEWYMFGVLLSIPLLSMYSEELGKKIKALKWGFYVFYPAHMLLLFAIRYFI